MLPYHLARVNWRAFNPLNFVRLTALAGLLAGAGVHRAAAEWTAGPFAHEFSLTLSSGTREEWLGPLYDIPIVATLDDALAHDPTSLLLGTAPVGGRIPPAWRSTIPWPGPRRRR